MLKLFSCKRPLRTLRQELPALAPERRDVVSAMGTHVSLAGSARAGDGSAAALPRREPAGEYVMVDNFS
jgi:hypothetical protein